MKQKKIPAKYKTMKLYSGNPTRYYNELYVQFSFPFNDSILKYGYKLRRKPNEPAEFWFDGMNDLEMAMTMGAEISE